jgi:hypothetical protein
MGGIYEVADEMGSGAMIYVPSFMKTGLGNPVSGGITGPPFSWGI